MFWLQKDEEKRLKKAKDAQAKANLAVKKQETIVKTAERALDDKVNSLVLCIEITGALTVVDTFSFPKETPAPDARNSNRAREPQDRFD